MKKVRFNWIDVIIILAIVAVAAFGIMYAKGGLRGGNAAVAAQEVTAVYTVEFSNKDISLADVPSVGDAATIGVKEKAAAEVVDVQVNPARRVTYDLSGNGKAAWEELPNRCDIVITLKSDAVETDAAVSASGVALRVGDEAVIRGKGYSAEGYILSVETTAKGGNQ